LRRGALTDLPPAVAASMVRVRAFNPEGGRGRYPRSPEVARQRLRPQDALRLFELHPADVQSRAAHHADRPRTEVHREDGFSGLRAQLPPPSRRGVGLIDPADELKADYGLVVATVREALQRFAEGVILVWYPQVTRLEAAQLPKRLKGLAQGPTVKGWLHARLTVQPLDNQGFGLAGSGMFVINPPHTLKDTLKEALPFLVQALGQDSNATHALESGS